MMKRIILFVCIGCCFTLVTAQVKVTLPEQIPILAWGGVPPNEASVARYREMKAAGITISLTRSTSADSTALLLDMAKKAGIKLVVRCPELAEEPEKTVKRFMNHPAVAGYYLRDEPSANDFATLGAWAERIQAADHRHFCYLNLLPNYATTAQLEALSYQQYVSRFLKEVPVPILSFDHYPIIEAAGKRQLRDQWYENLEIIADEAAKAGKPFWAFALTVAHGDYPIPTVGELKLQVYSNLAYGAQGIQYFTYWTPLNKTQYLYRHGPIAEGTWQRTEVYDRMQLVNRELQYLSGIFLNAKVISVGHTGQRIPSGTRRFWQLPTAIKKIETEGTGAIVSLLEKGNYRFLVIVNRDFKDPMQLTVTGNIPLEKILKDGTIVPADIYLSAMEVDPGDVVIYRWPNTASPLPKK